MESRECTSSKRDIQDVYLVPIGADFPSLVVECGGLPDRQEMIADMRDWFRKGHGKVVKVILMIWIMLPEAIMGGRIEAYDFDHVQDREILVREWVRANSRKGAGGLEDSIRADHFSARFFYRRTIGRGRSRYR